MYSQAYDANLHGIKAHENLWNVCKCQVVGHTNRWDVAMAVAFALVECATTCRAQPDVVTRQTRDEGIQRLDDEVYHLRGSFGGFCILE